MSAIATISLRPAALEDAELIFCWRNDPLIVRLGSLQCEVSRAEHEKWFAESISSQAREIFIVERDDTAIGQVRFDLVTKAECVISVYLATEFTGNGWGIDAIKQACQLIFELWPVQTVLACVRGENHAGQSAFRKAGFKQVDRRCGSDHESFQLDRLRI